MFYGLTSKDQAFQFAEAVCKTLGNANSDITPAVQLMLETAAAETMLGEYRDPTERSAGTGLTQVDESTFVWLQDKFKDRKEAECLKRDFGFTLAKVQYAELELSPLLAFVFCRLRYKVVPDPIPAWLSDRAEYWKKHYNSSAGKGTPTEYMQRCKECLAN